MANGNNNTTGSTTQPETIIPENRYYSALPLEERMRYAGEIAGELLEESDRQATLVMLLTIACRDSMGDNPAALHLATILEERILDCDQMLRLQSCFPERFAESGVTA